jgi:phosphoserine aminotransferase
LTDIFNFSAGPAVLPREVLQQAAAEMLDWHGSGMSVMEMSHRGPEFISIYKQAEADLRELLSVPANYRILFMQGGGLGQNAIIPMNLVGRAAQPATVDFVHTGSWSGKSISEARRYANVNVAASAEASGFTAVPPQDTWHLRPSMAWNTTSYPKSRATCRWWPT